MLTICEMIKKEYDMANLKYSRQREAIKDFLASRKDHPTADTVYINMRKEFPNISLGTVYRNLSLLVKIGEAIKVPCSDGSEHFDGCTRLHYHFQCSKCGAVLDLNITDVDAIHNLDKIANANFDGIVEGNSIFFYGLCPSCAKRVKKNNY